MYKSELNEERSLKGGKGISDVDSAVDSGFLSGLQESSYSDFDIGKSVPSKEKPSKIVTNTNTDTDQPEDSGFISGISSQRMTKDVDLPDLLNKLDLGFNTPIAQQPMPDAQLNLSRTVYSQNEEGYT